MKQFTTKSKCSLSKGTLEYCIIGKGEPTILLLNGGGGPMEGWYKILPQLSAHSTVLAYNRFGVGGSDKPNEPQDGIAIVESLQELLTTLQLEPPYLLVGHSLGGLYANLFARLYPSKVMGVVLLEATHPNDLVLNEMQGKVVSMLNGMLRFFDTLSSHKKYNEVHFVKETVEQIHKANHFPHIPLYVVTGGKQPQHWLMPQDAYDIRMKNQGELVSLSSKGKQIIAPHSGHFPQFTDPDIVVETILECRNAYLQREER